MQLSTWYFLITFCFTSTYSVKFNNEPVPNSPFEVAIRNTSTSGGGGSGGGLGSGANVVVSGNGIKMAAVNKLANFVINAPEVNSFIKNIEYLVLTSILIFIRQNLESTFLSEK